MIERYNTPFYKDKTIQYNRFSEKFRSVNYKKTE